jgi:hypothetical protein
MILKTKTKFNDRSFIMKTFVLFSFLAFFSCSQNETPSDIEKVDTKEMNFDNLRIDLGDWNIKTDSIILFQANNVEDLNNQVNTSFTYFIEGLDEIVRTNEEVNLYEFNIRLNQGEALITDIYFYNSERLEFVDVFQNGNAPDCVTCTVKNILSATNPEGFASSEICPDRSCMVAKVEEILTLEAGQISKDINFHISRNTNGYNIHYSANESF